MTRLAVYDISIVTADRRPVAGDLVRLHRYERSALQIRSEFDENFLD